MKQIKGDLFTEPCDAFCVTTNGFVTKRGLAVMGRGCAKTLLQHLPGADAILGHKLSELGNYPYKLGELDGKTVLSYPVKPESRLCQNLDQVVSHARGKYHLGSTIPGFHCVADLGIITASAMSMVLWADHMKWDKVVIPRPGCGAGELRWEVVKEVIEPILDDRFHIITFK